MNHKKALLESRLSQVNTIGETGGLNFGNIFTGSGYRKAEGHALDWALIKPEFNRIGINRVR